MGKVKYSIQKIWKFVLNQENPFRRLLVWDIKKISL